MTASLRDRIPVVALTGYLGAGKTTVLNHLLRRSGARIGVIVNDYGEINIDAGLVTGQIDKPSSISGGCICHLPDAGGLDDALRRLAHPRLALDAIVIEASGIAEPVTLAGLIRASPVNAVRPGGVVEVVDVPAYFATIDTGAIPPARFAATTLAVLNKTDQLHDDGLLDRVRARITTRNTRASIVVARGGGIDPALVLDTSSPSPTDELDLSTLIDPETHEHEHADGVTAATDGPADAGRIAALLEQPPVGIYRLKGTVEVAAGTRTRRYRLDLVGITVTVSERRDGGRGGQLVAIGMHLDVDPVQRRLHDALAHTGEDDAGAGLRRLERLARLSA